MTIGERIKQARKIRDMGQRELAKGAGAAPRRYPRAEYKRPQLWRSFAPLRGSGGGVEFFFRPKSIVAITPDYRKRRALPRKREAAPIAEI